MPLFKRAQLTAADLHRHGLAPAGDVAALTLIRRQPRAARPALDGVLELDPALVARIDREELLEHGSPEEVEIRACAVHAVELLVAAHGAHDRDGGRRRPLAPRRAPRYKAHPRHRARTTAY